VYTEISSLRTLKIMTRNLNEIVRSRIRSFPYPVRNKTRGIWKETELAGPYVKDAW
jgi:hypothetical protein